MVLDTYAFAKKFQESGFTPQQAEALVESLRVLIEENLATKQDLERVRSELMQAIELARRGIIIRLGAIVIGAVTILGVCLGVLIALVR